MKRCCLNWIEWYQCHWAWRYQGACRFHPSCSMYVHQAIVRHGALRGILLGIARLGRCRSPFALGYDPVPDRHQVFEGARGRLVIQLPIPLPKINPMPLPISMLSSDPPFSQTERKPAVYGRDSLKPPIIGRSTSKGTSRAPRTKPDSPGLSRLGGDPPNTGRQGVAV